MMAPPISRLQKTGPHSLIAELDLQPEQSCFAGHFDGWPVLAGVVQVDWVIRLAQQQLGCEQPFLGLRSIKFQQLIRPPRRVSLSIDYDPAQGLIRFSYRQEEQILSGGVVKVAEVLS